MAFMDNLVTIPGGIQTSVSLAILCFAYCAFYLFPALLLGAKLRRLRALVLAFIVDRTNPDTEITDSRLRAAWVQYRNTLRPAAGYDGALECTDRAEQHFSREGVIGSGLQVRLFKYLPPAALAIGAFHLAFAVIDATSTHIHLSQLLVAIRPASFVAAAAIGVALMMWLIQAQTLSWLSSILRATWLDLDAAFMKTASAAATDTDKSLSDRIESSCKRVWRRCAHLSSSCQYSRPRHR